MQNLVVKHRFGETYKVVLPTENVAQINLKPQQFWNEVSIRQFVNNLIVENGFWLQIVNQCNSSSAYTKKCHDIDSQISLLIKHNKLKFYPVNVLDIVEHPPEKRAIKSEDNIYRFEASSSLLFNNNEQVRKFKNIDDAYNFLNEISGNEAELSTIAKELNLKLPKTAYVNQGEITDTISNELISGNVVIIVDKATSTPPKDKEQKAGKSGVGARTAGLGDGDNSDTASNKDDKAKICELTNFTVKCNHKRSVEMKKGMAAILELDVVASETYKKDFEKITATAKITDVCGDHINNTSSIQPSPKSVVKSASSNIYTLTCEPYTNPLQNIWLPNVQPVSYTISPSADKKYEPSNVVVNVYPKIKWHGEMAYSFGEKESKRAENKNGNLENTHTNKSSKFTGKLELTYDGKKDDIGSEYKDSIDEVLNKLDWVRDKVDKVLSYFDGGESITLTVGWPNIAIAYTSELKEDKGREVVCDYKFSIGAAPLIKITGSVDFYPVLMKSLPATHGVYKVLEQVKKGIGNEKGFAHLQGEIKLELTVSSAINVNFISSGTNGKDNNNNKAESAIDIQFQLEGSVSAKGHVWVIKFEKSYKVGVKSGFVGKVIVDKDDEGIYWYSRFLFNGLVIYFTKYEKIEKNITSKSRALKRIKLDALVTNKTQEWVCIQPDPDEEAPYETEGFEKQSELDSSDKHYLMKF